MTGFNQFTLNDAVGVSSLTSGVILRDYTHAAKTFRTNSYQNAPKLKFLFHVYFDINPGVGLDINDNISLLVKDIKLPNFTLQTHQMNQYNRKRITQSKIKYDAIEVNFHDDNGNTSTKLWEAYYRYYYNDESKIGNIITGPGSNNNSITDYNKRNIYDESLTNDMGYGFSGGQNSGDGVKIPFFKNITVFGFNQHNFTAYTLINPVITNFGHDTYNYAEGGGTMTNRMTIDYETVVYDYGAMDGRSPGNIVKGFGDTSHYDTQPSPIVGTGQGTILGQGGLVNTIGGTVSSYNNGNIVGAVANAMATYSNFNQLTSPNTNRNIGEIAVTTLIREALNNTPIGRTALFNIPVATSVPGPKGLAGTTNISVQQGVGTASVEQVAGKQVA